MSEAEMSLEPTKDVGSTGSDIASNNRSSFSKGSGLSLPAWATRRRLAVALGVIWFIDGLLQLQPYMFTKGFVTGIILPNTSGQPRPLASSISAMAHFVQPHILFWNILFAVVQLAIGVGLVLRRTVKVTIIAAVIWSLLVWWVGEGFGGILTGTASLVTGAPGAVILYALLGIFAWPSRSADHAGAMSMAETEERSERADVVSMRSLRVLWAVIWGIFALFFVLPANLHSDALSQMVAGGAQGEPGFIASMDHSVAHLIAGDGFALSILLAVVCVAVAAGAFLEWRLAKWLLGIGALLVLVCWVVGQNFGGVLTGQGTDPNAGPLVLLYALVLAGSMAWRSRWSNYELIPEERTKRAKQVLGGPAWYGRSSFADR
ncbi:MAG: hypothetical protein M1519_01190 [Actinobacteria bacterium]|nr:hypothetical protein [Actinomycetota bacterium]